MSYEWLFVKALGATVFLETITLIGICRFFLGAGQRPALLRLIFAGFLCSFATLPYLWFVLPACIHSYYLLMVVGEVSVTLAEAGFLMVLLDVNWVKAASFSLVCNSVSFGIGLLI